MSTSLAEQQAAAAERRVATRHPAAEMTAITGIRLSPGGREAFLVNISTTGVLVRCATRLLPGTPITVVFEGGFSPSSTKGRVVRCMVADIGREGGLSYHIGVAFNGVIPLGEEPVETPVPVAEVPPAAAAAVLVNRW